MNPIRILIADDHNLVRDGIRAILQHVEDFEVVDEACDGLEVLEKMRTKMQNLILMYI